MEKKPFSFILKKDNETIGFQGNEIEVSKFITFAEKTAIIDNYLANYLFPNQEFMGSIVKQDYIGAEYALILAIVDLKTNIDITHEKFNLEDFVNLGLWKQVQDAIKNYPEFRQELDRVVSDTKEQLSLEKSIGSIIDNLSIKAMLLLETLGEKLSETDLNQLKETANTLVAELKAAPISEIFQDVEKQKISKKSIESSKVH